MSRLIGSAIDNLVTMNIRTFTLTDPQLSVDQCDQLIGLLMDHQEKCTNAHEEAVRMDYIAARQTIEDLQTGALELSKVRESLESMNLETSGLTDIDYDAERTVCNQVFAAIVRDEEVPYHQARTRIAESGAEIQKLVAGAKLVKVLSVPFATRSVTEWRNMELAGTMLVTAVRRFELERGYLPASLPEAIAGTALGEVPLDPLSGEPMKYVVIEGQPTVYSVGRDGKDNGGRINWIDNISKGQGDTTGDALFVLTPFPGTRPRPQDAPALPTSVAKSREKSFDEMKVDIRGVITILGANRGRWDKRSTGIVLAALEHSDWRIPARAFPVITGNPLGCPIEVREKVEAFEVANWGDDSTELFTTQKQKALEALQASAPPSGSRPAAASETASTPPADTNASPTIRTWTSTVGTTLEAELVRLVQNNKVALLKRKDGSTVRVPLDKLSAADREWIQKAE